MEEEKNKSKGKSITIVLLLAIALVLILFALVITGKINLKSTTNTNTSNNVDNVEEEVKTDSNDSINTNSENTNNNEDDGIINGNINTEKTENWKVTDEAKKYITLEDVALTDEVSTKKVKFVNLSDNVTSQFYKDQQALIDSIQIYNDEYFKGNAEYKLKAFVNNNILSVVYLLEEENMVGKCGSKMAVTNIDLANNKVITQEELLAKANTSYKKLTEIYYNNEKERWAKLNEDLGQNMDYYEVTFEDFSNNKSKYVNIGLEKLPNIIYVYIEDGKIKYDYYTIFIGSLFHQVGKGGCFDWATTVLGDYK